jgi:hypothetical protein
LTFEKEICHRWGTDEHRWEMHRCRCDTGVPPVRDARIVKELYEFGSIPT